VRPTIIFSLRFVAALDGLGCCRVLGERVPRRRAGDQGAWPHHPGDAVGHRRRGDPIAGRNLKDMAASLGGRPRRRRRRRPDASDGSPLSPLRPDRDFVVSSPRQLLGHKPAELQSVRRRLLDRHRHVPIEQGYVDIDAAQVDPVHESADARALSPGLRQNPVHRRLKVESWSSSAKPRRRLRSCAQVATSIWPREDIRRQCACFFASLARRSRSPYQRAVRSDQLIPIIAIGVVEQVGQCMHRCEGLHSVHARNVLRPRLTNG
jgi:hypothetical protein